MLNVDLGRLGGVSRRDAVNVFNIKTCDTIPQNMWSFGNGAGTYQVMIQSSSSRSSAWYADATATSPTFIPIPNLNLTVVGKMRAATMQNLCFVQRNAEQVAWKWDGTNPTTLGTSFNDNFAAPTANNMPKAKCITAWGGYMWIANTVEAGTAFKSRVRFSHPNQPADFRTNDYIDVDIGHDGDEITALVPYHDRLLVFKNNSVHSIFGFDFTTFSEQVVSTEVGAVSQEAVASSEDAVYFFSNPNGLYRLDSGGVAWAFSRLSSLLNNSLTYSQLAATTVGWINRRIWVSLPVNQGGVGTLGEGQTANNTLLILDPSLARHRRYMTIAQRLASEGGWTQYDLGLGAFLALAVPGQNPLYLAASVTQERVIKLHDSQTLPSDTVYSTGVTNKAYSTPDTVATSITGDLTVVARAAGTWASGATQTLTAKWETGSNQRSWSLTINATGFPVLEWSNDGTTVLSATSTQAVPVAAAVGVYIRASLDVVNGANKTVKFEFSDNGVDYTRYTSSTVTTAGNTSIFDSTASTTIGGRGNATPQQPFTTGSIQRVVIASGLPGATVNKLSPDFTLWPGGTINFIDPTSGATWTSVSGQAMDYPSPTINSYYVTRWFDLGEPARKKRWRRPELAFRTPIVSKTFTITSYRDYSTSSGYRTLTCAVPSGGGGETIVKMGALGLGRAVRLKFADTGNQWPWALDAVTFKYVPRRVLS